MATGNPVYPTAISQSWTQGHSKAPGQSRLQRFWRVPWRAQFDGVTEFESPLPNPMGLALLVFLPLVILVPGPSTSTRRACLLFCALYLAYWIPTVGMLRYAILPLSLLVVLLTGKAAAFYDVLNGRLLRASVSQARLPAHFCSPSWASPLSK